MRFLYFLIVSAFFIVSCDESANDEIYNENNTNVSAGVVYNIDEKPINGLYRVYYPDGNIKMEIQSKNGKPNGIGKFYTAEGSLYMQGAFSDGQSDGVFYNYYPNGQVHNEMNYVKGVKDGVQKSYDESGKLEAEVVFENGSAKSGYVIINNEKAEFTPEELAELN